MCFTYSGAWSSSFKLEISSLQELSQVGILKGKPLIKNQPKDI